MTFFFKTDVVYLDQSSKMKRRRRQIGQICLLLAGIILISAGVSIFVFFESIYEFILREALRFAPTSQAYLAWQTNDPPLRMDIYVFNWTNPEEIGNPDVKPEFEEVGPYTFKEIKEKINITWHEHNSTISYAYKKLYFYDEENSVRKLNDVISTINIVPLTIGYKIRHASWWTKRVISATLSSVSSLYVTKNVSQILFEGYEEPILGTLSKFPFLNVQDKFGIFYGKNNTMGQEGFFSMHYANDEDFGKILTWNFKNRTEFYEGHCNDIRGSSGEFYPINRKRDKLILYSDQLCKYAEFEYVEDVVIKGVKGYKYTADNIFDNGTTRPENACFCKGECLPSGVFNVSACRDNSPSFLSFPHFYQADPYYTDAIKGMRPDKTKHEFYITIEPKSGIIMDIQLVMQINMLLQPIRSVRLYEKVPKVFLPLFYIKQNVNLKDDIASSLKIIQNFPEYCNYTFYILVGLGCLSIFWAFCSCFWCYTSNKQKFEINGKIATTSSATIRDEIPLRGGRLGK
ncbi:unnamed protein product [Psylliodes chrysocephalus]|uniref:Protein croquemort-like n=1 Tax=Psylliodes chrysocephalus TaxID=3402493 RepID=A0A9P0GEF6_9CUCU|nr:unnamed protein product [Psylliodes chrysocephala]